MCKSLEFKPIENDILESIGCDNDPKRPLARERGQLDGISTSQKFCSINDCDK